MAVVLTLNVPLSQWYRIHGRDSLSRSAAQNLTGSIDPDHIFGR